MEKLFLCFWVGDGGDRESFNALYSTIVKAKTKSGALKKYMASDSKFGSSDDVSDYGIKEIEKIID